MATEIEKDAGMVLEALSDWSEQEDDPARGRYDVTGAELAEKLGLPPSRINDAVEFLSDHGYVHTIQTFGTRPYDFREVSLENSGRQAYQRSLLESNNDQLSAIAYDVFLSHSSLDDGLANVVKQLLEVNGIRVFATPGSVPTGSWEPQIEEALRSSGTVWLLLTPNALRESVWTHHEFFATPWTSQATCCCPPLQLTCPDSDRSWIGSLTCWTVGATVFRNSLTKDIREERRRVRSCTALWQL